MKMIVVLGKKDLDFVVSEYLTKHCRRMEVELELTDFTKLAD